MALSDNIIAQRQSQTGALAGGLGGEKGLKDLGLHLGRDARAVVINPNLDLSIEPLSTDRYGGLVA